LVGSSMDIGYPKERISRKLSGYCRGYEIPERGL